jgi:hypothetical protein
MTTIRAWIARLKWDGWIILAAVIAICTLVLRRMFAGTSERERQRFQLPAVPPEVQQRVRDAEEHAIVTQIQASAQAEAKKEELQQVMQIPDGNDGGAERRRRLAALLRTLN